MILMALLHIAYPEAVDNLHIKLLASDLCIFYGLQFTRLLRCHLLIAADSCSARLLDTKVRLLARALTQSAMLETVDGMFDQASFANRCGCGRR